MERAREKLSSRRGASILIALLFLLVCMLVAASVLMAAVSNAGKLKSSREEHQKYLTLSSALRLVCGELTQSSYAGSYTYTKEEVKRTVTITNEDGSITTEEELDHYKHTYTQEAAQGEYKFGLNQSAVGGDVLPLTRNLDWLFGEQLMKGLGVDQNPDDEYVFTAGHYTGIAMAFPVEYTLTVEGDELQPVTIRFRLRKDGFLHLTAQLQTGAGGQIYAMEAELEPETPLTEAFALADTAGSHETEPVKWKLNWIDRREEAAP